MGDEQALREVAYYRRRFQSRVFATLVDFVSTQSKAENITKKDLAERLGKDPGQLSKLLGYPSNLTLDTISDLLLALDAEAEPPVIELFADKRPANYMHPLMARALKLEQPTSLRVLTEIGAERRHQIDDNGWSAEHDDTVNACGQLVTAAFCVLGRHDDARMFGSEFFDGAPARWPWLAQDGRPSGWKSKGLRQDLVRCCAMLVAEIERLDRATPNDRKDGSSQKNTPNDWRTQAEVVAALRAAAEANRQPQEKGGMSAFVNDALVAFLICGVVLILIPMLSDPPEGGPWQ